MTVTRTAADGLKYATYLWRAEHDAESARGVLDDLYRDHADSGEAATVSNLLEEINNGAASIDNTKTDVRSKDALIGHATAAIFAASGIGLAFFGTSVMYSGPVGDGGI